MISHKYECIFIHIPKCAGTSIEFAFGHMDGNIGSGGQDHRILRHIEQPLLQCHAFLSFENLRELRRRIKHKAKYQKNIKNLYNVNLEQFNSYYKFSIVRNPWSRAHSWYKNVMRDKNHQNNLSVYRDETFEEFLKKFAGKGYLRPQLYWLKNFKGELDYNFIGKFEHLNGDFKKICTDLGYPDLELPHYLESKPSDYRNHYNTEMKKLVFEIYREEIELFNYTFDT